MGSNQQTAAAGAAVAEGALYLLPRDVKFQRFAWHTDATWGAGAGVVFAAYQAPQGQNRKGNFAKVFEIVTDTNHAADVPVVESLPAPLILRAGVFHLVYAAQNANVTNIIGWDITSVRLLTSGLPPGEPPLAYTWPGTDGTTLSLPDILTSAQLAATSGNTGPVHRIYTP